MIEEERKNVILTSHPDRRRKAAIEKNLNAKKKYHDMLQ